MTFISGCDLDEEIKHLNSGKVNPATLPFSEAVKTGKTLYLSGQIGNKPGSMDLPPTLNEQANQVMTNIHTVLEHHGYRMSDLVKCTVFMKDMNEWDAFNKIYISYFEEGKYPARSAFGSTALAFGAKFEVECIAYK